MSRGGILGSRVVKAEVIDGQMNLYDMGIPLILCGLTIGTFFHWLWHAHCHPAVWYPVNFTMATSPSVFLIPYIFPLPRVFNHREVPFCFSSHGYKCTEFPTSSSL